MPCAKTTASRLPSHREPGSDDADQVRRLLALAVVYDGGLRSDGAEAGGVGLQTFGCVHEFWPTCADEYWPTLRGLTCYAGPDRA